MKIIIFDFDGTLGDTQAVVVKSFKETVVRGGYDEPSEKACESVIGLSLDDCFKVMLKCDDAEAFRLSEIYQKDVFPQNVAAVKVKPFPYVIETLEELKSQGYVMTIATSRAKDSAMSLIPMSGVGQYMSDIVTPQDVDNGKPAPDLAQKILEKYCAVPSETFIVGDAPCDVMMGKNAGCKTCAVTYGNGSPEALKQVKPDYMIDDIRQLTDILRKCL